MMRAFENAAGSSRLHLLAVLATFLTAGCGSDSASPVALDPPDATSEIPGGAPLAAVTYTGIPYGAVSLWLLNKPLGPLTPFTASTNYINADTLILQINAARAKGHRLVVAMTGGATDGYTTNGQFDLAKWKKVMNTYNKATIKTAVAAAVTDGTLIGNQLIDEPETKRWGTVLTKAMIDQMAVYAKTIFPTLPMGVNHGPPGYKWRATERYTKVDYVRYQYDWYITSGNVGAWRTAVLAQATHDGVTPALSMNVINGGTKDKGDGLYDCAGTGGLGTRYPNCKMTPDQIKAYGKALLPYGCFLMHWEYEPTFFAKSTNQAAFKEVATAAAALPKKSCKRP